MKVLLRNNNEIIKTQEIKLNDTLRTLRSRVNDNFTLVDDNLELLEGEVSSIKDNTYISNIMKGVFGSNTQGDISTAYIQGKFVSKFGENFKDTLQLDSKGINIVSERSVDEIGISGGFEFVINNPTVTEDGDSDGTSVYTSVDLTKQETYAALRNGDIFIIRIGSLANILCNITVGLLGKANPEVLKLNPGRPSITLQKVGDAASSRFLVLAYPNINPSDLADEDVIEIKQRLTDVETTTNTIINTLTWEEHDQ